MSDLTLKQQENTGVVYADPASNLTVRFRNTSSQKTLNGVTTKNCICEIIANDENEVEVADSIMAKDAVSVRVRVSGSPLSEARLVSIITAIGAKLATWGAEHCFIGFNPTTKPTIPV